MPKERKPAARSEKVERTKKPQNFRFTPETIRRLGVAARKYGMSRTAYTELALQDRFKKDGVQ
jgi:hypothetical protein